MKKRFLIILVALFWCNLSNAKIINVGFHKLDVPDNFYLSKLSEYNFEFTDKICRDFENCYLISSKKIKEILNEIDSGKDYEDIKLLRPIITKINKLSNSSYNSVQKNLNSLLSTIRFTLKKHNSEKFFGYTVMGNSGEVLNNYDLGTTILEEIRNMSNDELENYSKELRNDLNIGNDYYSIGEGIGIKLKTFKISKAPNKTPYLFLDGEVYFESDKRYKILRLNYYVSEYKDKIFDLCGLCATSCSKFNSVFNQIINKSFHKQEVNNSTSSFIKESFVDQLKQLNNLYKEGALTKEEFDEAKKKLLN